MKDIKKVAGMKEDEQIEKIKTNIINAFVNAVKTFENTKIGYEGLQKLLTKVYREYAYSNDPLKEIAMAEVMVESENHPILKDLGQITESEILKVAYNQKEFRDERLKLSSSSYKGKEEFEHCMTETNPCHLVIIFRNCYKQHGFGFDKGFEFQKKFVNSLAPMEM